jgi:hypothetical protein
MKVGKNRFQRFVRKKCGVFFDGAYAIKKLEPKWHIALQPIIPIRHLPPGQLRPDGAYRDQGPKF